MTKLGDSEHAEDHILVLRTSRDVLLHPITHNYFLSSTRFFQPMKDMDPVLQSQKRYLQSHGFLVLEEIPLGQLENLETKSGVESRAIGIKASGLCGMYS